MYLGSLNAARTLMGDSLGFHIIFVIFGVGLPLIVSLVEFWSIRAKDQKLREEARRLAQVATVLVVTGVVSGTLIAIQMSLMWSGLVKFGNRVIGLPFMFEGYAFLLEALFLGYYASTWDKLKGYKHWLLSLPIIAGSLLSAIFITMVDAWMNRPGGFDLKNGEMVNVHAWSGLLTGTAAYMITHSVISYYLAISLVVLAGYAILSRSKKASEPTKRVAGFIMRRMAALALVLVLIVAVIGHFQTQFMSRTQPRKFAAMENVAVSSTNADYVLGGHLNPAGTAVDGGVRIKGMLSLLAGNSSDYRVPGLDQFPKRDWPLLIINKLFEVKMLLVGLVMLAPAAYLLINWKRKQYLGSKAVKWLLIAGAVASFVVIELGWMVTELGRQPFAVNGYLRTSEAFSNKPGLLAIGYMFPVLFVVLFIVTAATVRVVLKRFAANKEVY